MSKEKYFFIYPLIAVLFFGCYKGTTEEKIIANFPTSLPNVEQINIRSIDFNNFTYLNKEGKPSFTLKDGIEPFENLKDIEFKMKRIDYADLTNDKFEEAIIHITVEYGAGSSGLLYVYTIENNQPRILWYAETGYGVKGELKSAFSNNNNLVVELLGENKFNDHIGEFEFVGKDSPRNSYYPEKYTRFVFKWDGEKFIVDGNPQLLNFNSTRQNSKN